MIWTPETRRAAGCRMCSECRNYSHHWFDDFDESNGKISEYSCKHCDVRGVPCPECEGEGYVLDIDYVGDYPVQAGRDCGACDGEGVVAI